MLCTHGKTQKAKGTHRAPKHPRKEPCTPAAARAGSGIVPQVTQAQSHRGSEQPGAGARGTRLHAGDAAGGGNQRTQFTHTPGQ